MSSGAEQQDDLEQMLDASRELRASYRAGSSEEPSAGLDAAIRAQARRAVGSRPRLAGSPFSAAWRVPVSIAAVMVLSVTVTVMTVRQERHMPAADQPPEHRNVPAAESTPSASAPGVASAPPPPPIAQHEQETSKAPAMKDQSAESHAPAAGGALRLERQLAKTSPAPAERDERPARERKKEAEAFPAAPASGAPGQQMPPASARSSEAAEARGVQGQPEQERAQEQSADALTNTAPAAHTRDDASKTASSNAVQAQGRLRENSTLAHDERAAPAKQKAAPEPADAVEPSRKAAAVASWESDPKAWLRHIESLVREQRLGEARDSFKAFRQRYPAYPIPAEFPLPER